MVSGRCLTGLVPVEDMMAFDRYDSDVQRDERSRWSGDRDRERGWGGDHRPSDDRGFWDRASDEVASWFGDDDAERRRREDQMREERDHGVGERHRHFGDRSFDRGRRDFYTTRGINDRGGFADSDYSRSWRGELYGPGNRERDWDRERSRDYRPMTGDYGRGFGREDRDFDRSSSPWGRDEYRSTSRAGTSDWSDRSRHEDPQYRSWRDRHLSDLDRDYEDYRREHQRRFENDFGSWRERRQQKRGLLGQIREHMEVVGNDDERVGTVDKCAGDRIILTKSDPESGGAHHSLSCSDIDRIEGDRVILDCSADQARGRWRDESRSRALFEREDQGEMGPRSLNRSFEGTYR
jgi:hypothetical protein